MPEKPSEITCPLCDMSLKVGYNPFIETKPFGIYCVLCGFTVELDSGIERKLLPEPQATGFLDNGAYHILTRYLAQVLDQRTQ